jgi:hypothetical protein
VPSRINTAGAEGKEKMPIAPFKLDDSEHFAQKMLRLRQEAQANAREHTAAFVNALEHLEALAAAIADGGEAYSVGVRETARALAPDLEGARLNVASIMGRAA